MTSELVSHPAPRPREILDYLERSLEASILKQVDNIEHLLETAFEESVNPEERKHINFAIEVHGRSFVIRPYNLFTFILSEGDYVPYEKVQHVNRYENWRGTYVYNPIDYSGVFVPNNPPGHDAWLEIEGISKKLDTREGHNGKD